MFLEHQNVNGRWKTTRRDGKLKEEPASKSGGGGNIMCFCHSNIPSKIQDDWNEITESREPFIKNIIVV